MGNKSTQELKVIMKENRKLKNRNYWMAWSHLNQRYNMGEV
jgi:hypothetical protein|tara:strand:- start:197 stop:319 length:123 start_codon:yes stop_codon:yes gene_type:complete